MDKLLIRLGMLKPEATHVQRVCNWFLVWAGALFAGGLELKNKTNKSGAERC
jgi:hypothetical protein